MAKLRFSLVAPERELFSGEVDQVDAPGAEGDFGSQLGLDNAWAKNIIEQVGNYGESFTANVGPETELGIERGLNALWTEGGLQYAPPIR